MTEWLIGLGQDPKFGVVTVLLLVIGGMITAAGLAGRWFNKLYREERAERIKAQDDCVEFRDLVGERNIKAWNDAAAALAAVSKQQQETMETQKVVFESQKQLFNLWANQRRR